MIIGKTDLGNFPVLLAPLEDITDSAFRRICKSFGADLVYTEFISSEALSREVEKSMNKMLFAEEERPLGIQIFGNDPEAMKKAAQLAEQSGPELIDINFGCPVRKIAMKGAGAALLKDVPLMVRITEEVVKAVKLPVTVKTRLGWDENSKNIVDIAERLQDVGISALTIHGRTRSQMYTGKADWTLIGEVKNNQRMVIPIIGNGDVTGPEIAIKMHEDYGVDAVMIGRGAIGNPWIFRETKDFINKGILPQQISLEERRDTCLKHLRLTLEQKQERRAIMEFRKHYSGYFRAVPNFKQIKMKLLTAGTFTEIEDILANLDTNPPL
ncbi:MAG: tRNA dihydrouridine synthase DusB [Bacteroidales bacterium]|nr:tRNA dihydrouridine synthase DusB [Bacteroidales bacterium]